MITVIDVKPDLVSLVPPLVSSTSIPGSQISSGRIGNLFVH